MINQSNEKLGEGVDQIITITGEKGGGLKRTLRFRNFGVIPYL